MCSPIYQFENVLFVEIHYVGFKKNVLFFTLHFMDMKKVLCCVQFLTMSITQCTTSMIS